MVYLYARLALGDYYSSMAFLTSALTIFSLYPKDSYGGYGQHTGDEHTQMYDEATINFGKGIVDARHIKICLLNKRRSFSSAYMHMYQDTVPADNVCILFDCSCILTIIVATAPKVWLMSVTGICRNSRTIRRIVFP